jgi:phosphoglycolate phosphatase-like HAD superfamily hydrolase
MLRPRAAVLVLAALPLSARAAPVSRGGTDARPFLRQALAEIAARARRGEPVCVVFDIDNTLADTRPRTAAAAHGFAGLAATVAARPLAHVAARDVGIDGRETCTLLGIRDRATVSRFQVYWRECFWRPQSFRLDRPIPETIRLARRAKRAGAEVFYLTGRVEQLRRTTLTELRRFGLPDVDDQHLLCKSAERRATPPYKASMLRGLLRAGQHVAWFISEGRRDIAHLQRTVPAVPCVRYDFPLDQRPPLTVRRGTPVLACSVSRRRY